MTGAARGNARSDQQIQARAASMLARENPTYIKELGG